MITVSVPADWRDLQDQVGQILSECGFEVAIEKQLQTVRGTVELDVWAHEDNNARKSTIVCECKHWRARVSQSVIHGFRTVLDDIGAHFGYIVSSSGYQAGAYAAAANTNIELLTWTQFQEKFAQTWFKAYMSPYIGECLAQLQSFVDPYRVPAWFTEVSLSQQRAYLELMGRYSHFAAIVMSLRPQPQSLGQSNPPDLPLLRHVPAEYLEHVPIAIKEELGLREFLALTVEFAEELFSRRRSLGPQ